MRNTLLQHSFALVLAALLAQSSIALAEDADTLDGSGYLGEEGCPGGIKSEDCIFTFEIRGKAAKVLFEGMRDKAVREECTGGMEKSDGSGLHCIKSDDNTYNCDFGFDFAGKRFGGSAVSC